MLRKALTLPADALIFDLEDSVTPDNKEAAREAVCGWLGEVAGAAANPPKAGPRQFIVRVNPLDSQWGRADLEAVLPHKPDAVMLPKVESREMVLAADSLLATAEAEAGMEAGAVGLIVIGTETPAAVFQLPAMVEPERVQGLAWGAEDLSAGLGSRRSRGDDGTYLEVFRLVRSLSLLAATAGSVQPIDTVFTDIKDLDGLRAECELAVDMGFTGKLTIHPTQVEVVNAAFTPPPHEVEQAKELLRQFAEHEKQGRMAFTFKGLMVDAPHLKRAQRIVALSDALEV